MKHQQTHEENEEQAAQTSQTYTRYGVPAQSGTPFVAVPPPSPQNTQTTPETVHTSNQSPQFRTQPPVFATGQATGTEQTQHHQQSHGQVNTTGKNSNSSSLFVLPFTPFLAIAGFCIVFTASFTLRQVLMPSHSFPPAIDSAPPQTGTATGTASDGILASVNTLPSTNLADLQEGQKRFFQMSDLKSLANGSEPRGFVGFEGANLSGAGQDQWAIRRNNGNLEVLAWSNGTVGEGSGTVHISSFPHGAYQKPVTVAMNAFGEVPSADVDTQSNPYPHSSESSVLDQTGDGRLVRGSSSPIQQIEKTTVDKSFVSNGWNDKIDP